MNLKESKIFKICFGFLIINLILISLTNLFGAKVVTLSLRSDKDSEIQFFYITKDGENFSEYFSESVKYKSSDSFKKVRALIFTKNINNFRVDFGNTPSEYEVQYLSISDGLFNKKIWDKNLISKEFIKCSKELKMYSTTNNILKVESLGKDGYIVGENISGVDEVNYKVFLFEIVLIVLLILFMNKEKIREFFFKISRNKFITKSYQCTIKEIRDVNNEFKIIKEYILKNKYIIYIASFFAILAHGVSLFYYKVSIDSEIAIINYSNGFNSKHWIGQGRFGIAVLKNIFSTGTITIPAYNIFLALTTLVLYIILSLFIINKYSEKDNKLANIIFAIMFISFSQIPTYMMFVMYSFEFSVGYLMVAISMIFTCRIIFDKKLSDEKTGILSISIGIGSLMFAISIYQSFISLYISSVCIIFLLKGKSYGSENLIEEIKKILKFISILIISIAIYFLVNYILTSSAVQTDGYFGDFIGWKKDDVFVVISKVIHSIKTVIFGSKYYGLELLKVFYTIGFLILVVLVLNFKIDKFIYLFGVLISPFVINIILGSSQPLRTLVALPLFVGIICYSAIIVLKSKLLQKVIFCLIFIMGMYQSQCTAKLYFSDYVKYEQDVQLGNRIAQEIEKLDLGEKPKYPVVYIGTYSSNDKELIIRNEVIGYSFFEWDGGSISRIRNFMDIIGHDYLYPSKNDIKKAYESSKNMPEWPNSGSVKLENDVIIVKLSVPGERWKMYLE